MCRRVHGLHPEHENIRDADDIATVWNQFCEFIKSNIGRQQVGVLVAWNGVTCDMRLIHKLCQAPNSIFELPTSIKYFMDPMSVIREYKGCKLNKKHSKIESYELGVVWSFIKKCNLNGAHDSLVDVKAQTDIIILGKNEEKKFVTCKKKEKGSCHRADKENIKFKITPGYIIAWIAILIYHDAKHGGQTMFYWDKKLDGDTCAPIQNTISRNAFEFMRRYIHFENNAKGKNRNHELFDPLYKIRNVLTKVMRGIQKESNAGERVTIDESMIKYMGKAISFVQYLPLKPVKHGIKVFALYCAYTAYLLNFEVYLGKDYSKDGGSALNVIDRLIVEANLHTQRGRIAFTDNWYISVDLAKHLYERDKWTLVGTITPIEKKARKDYDVPFLKLSDGASKLVNRGWYREAVAKVQTKKGGYYKIQCTTWRDKKQVMF